MIILKNQINFNLNFLLPPLISDCVMKDPTMSIFILTYNQIN